MNIKIPDITFTSLETLTAFNHVTGDFRFMLDELQDWTLSNTVDKQDVTGKLGRKLNSLKRNKAVTITGNNGLISAGLLEAQTGSAFEEKIAAPIMWTDYLSVASNAATTNYKAVGTTGNEIIDVFVRNDDGTLGTKLTQDTATASGKFTYAPETKILTFNSGDIEDGTEIVVHYKRQIKAHVLDNMSDKYSEKLTIYADLFGEDSCGNVYRVQIFIPKADFDGNFDITAGSDQAVHAFSAESLAGGSCGGTAGSLWTYSIFGEDAADA